MAESAVERLECASCGRANRAGRKFCAGCGAPLVAACSVCGAANEPDERFCGECGSRLDGAAAPVREAHARAAGVERRVVSVLFADLVGFTALAEGRDAEDVRDLLSRYFDIARQLVERYGGVVEKFIGDAVMAVWGTPIAQEDDAERAVRAALDLVEAVTALGSELEARDLTARVGVLTGEAAVTLGAEGQGMVAGDLVNAASRVQSIAEPGTVVVGETTRRASDAAIAYADAGVHELRGREDTLHLWRALRVTAGRAGSLKWEGIEPPFVGRERELRLVKEFFHASADERKAHLVSVVGIAGIGKSRLAWELRKYADGLAQAVSWHQGRCLAYGEGVTYWALAEMVRMHAGIAEGEMPESARTKLHEALALHIEDVDERAWIEPRLAHLLALEEPHAAERHDLFGGWRLFFERIAEREPVVLVFEDMQWADGPLLEFLDHLLEWSRNHAIFVFALARPELADRHPHWASAGRNSTTLALEPLSSAAMHELLDGFVPGLPEQLLRQILDSSEGVPLYAVETVRMLLDRGLLEAYGDGYRLTGPVDSLEVPETLHALIAARLDGLAAAERRLLQDASVLGKTFSQAALAAVVAEHAGPDLVSLLGSLVRKEVLSLQADPRSPERGQYGFLQDLLRQVAYETLSRKERKTGHLAAAAYLEQQWLDGEQDVVEIVASHYLTALELDPKAADFDDIRAKALTTLRRAGERAASLAASESAQRYFEQALELTDETVEQAELHEQAGRMAMRSERTAGARSHFERAIVLYEAVGRPLAGVRVSAKLGELTWTQEGNIEQAVIDMERSFDVLVDEERSAELATLAAQLARVLYFSGRADEAIARNELALEIAEALQLPEVLSHALNTKSLILSFRGRHAEANILLRHALDVALAHDLSEAALRAYGNLSGVAYNLDRYRESLDWTHAAAELAGRVGDRAAPRNWSAVSVLIEVGEWDEALALDEELARDVEPVSAQGQVPILLLRAPILLKRGELDEARRRMDAAKELVDPNDVQWRSGYGALEAHMLLAEGRFDEALASAEEVLAARAELGIMHDAMKSALEAALTAAFSRGNEAKVDEFLGIIEGVPPGHATPYLRALGARFGAQRAARQGDSVTASAGFSAAADLFREMERPFELAVVRLEHAEWLAAEGRAAEAVEPADEARGIFERLRATPWLERLDDVPTPAEKAVVE